MSVTVYAGVMGAGKSHEAVKTVVLPALSKGRRVVTNISGLSEERCRQYLVAKGLDASAIGSVVVVPNERVTQPGFFPGEAVPPFNFEVPTWVPLAQLHYFADEWSAAEGRTFTKTVFQLVLRELKKLQAMDVDLGSALVTAAASGEHKLDAGRFVDSPRGEVFADLPDDGPSVVQPGDMVVIDEGWRYWADGGKLSAEHMNFFRMHRHYVDADSGVACDVLIIIQDFASLNRFLKGVVELTVQFTKLKSLGLMSRYRVDVYEGKPKRASLVSSSPWQKYDPKIFPLYHSYDGGEGREAKTDDRQNLFANKWFVLVGLVAVVGFIASSVWMVRFVGRLRQGGAVAVAAAASSPGAAPHGYASVPVAPGASAPGGATAPDVYRLVGVVEGSDGTALAWVAYPDGRVVRIHVSAGVLDGWQSTAAIQGHWASFFWQGRGK